MKVKRKDIASANDHIRRELCTRSCAVRKQARLMITRGCATIGGVFADIALLRKVAEFNTFTKDNDPHREHDFGKIVHQGTDYFWKFDYYEDDKLQMGADPYAPKQYPNMFRVLTVMRADEY